MLFRSVEPIFPAVALSMVLAQVARPPFANTFITFSANPQLVQLDPARTLWENIQAMESSEWGMNTAFHKVFLDLLLPAAIKHNVPPEDMIKRLFVFSDMQFDEAQVQDDSADGWNTAHDVVEQKFREAGYELPEIVYWNLSQYSNTLQIGRAHV